MDNSDAVRRYMGRAEFEKATHSLLGLVNGIAIDGRVNEAELQFLEMWIADHRIRADRHPFNELIPRVEAAIADGVLDAEERADILWLCEKLVEPDYFDAVTVHMQHLHAILAGIAADAEITIEELSGLREWIQAHEPLKGLWPYDEIEAVLVSVFRDGRIDPDEHAMLLRFFGEFVAILDGKTIVSPVLLKDGMLAGVCAVCPEIRIEGSVFCLTGKSFLMTRAKFQQVISDLGGIPSDSMTDRVDYLVVGAEGNPCWAYACYGRKVERAVELRKQGRRIQIVHENDFHDAVADSGKS